MNTIYDVMILGAGPAGLTAALYAGRSGLNTLLLEQGQDGGQIALTDEIENYPGQLEGESGAALIARMSAQAERFGAVRARDVIRSAELTGTVKTLTGLQNAYRAHAVILASGATPRPIGCKNEEQYVGRGISYCATCDAGFFLNKAVYVAGSNSIAVEEALYLTGFAREVTLLCGRERLSAPKALQERAFAQPKLHILWNTAVAEVGGSGSAVLDRMVLKDTESGAETVVQAERLFGLPAQLPAVCRRAGHGRRVSCHGRGDAHEAPRRICRRRYSEKEPPAGSDRRRGRCHCRRTGGKISAEKRLDLI